MNGEVAFILALRRGGGRGARSRWTTASGRSSCRSPALETYELAWALTVHRAQGSQFPAVVAPWSTAYAVMLSRALLYTAVTRAQRLCVLVGERKAVAMALGRSGSGGGTPRSPSGSAATSRRRPRRSSRTR